MPRRKRKEINDVQVIFRTTEALKIKIDAAADAKGLSTADWLRNLVEDELEHGNYSKYWIAEEANVELAVMKSPKYIELLTELIRKEVREEMLKNQSNQSVTQNGNGNNAVIGK